MSTPKITWRVSAAPTGRYRSFKNREWPSASYGSADGPPCAYIGCDDEYVPKRAATGDHAPLKVYIAWHANGTFK